MSSTKTTPLNEQQLTDLMAEKFSCAHTAEAVREAIKENSRLQDEEHKLSTVDIRETMLITQSAQGIYFGAFTKWLCRRIQEDNLDEHLTDVDRHAGINRDTLVNPYIGMIPTIPKMRALGCEEQFLLAKTRTLEFLVSCHAGFKRQIEDGSIQLTPGEAVADAIIFYDYDKPSNGRLSKSYKKASNWLLNLDEACNIYISTYTAVLAKHYEETSRDMSLSEARIVSEQLYKFLNGAAHLPRYRGMTLVHQIDFGNAGIDFSYNEGRLHKVTLSGAVNDASLAQLNDNPLTKGFLAYAKESLLSTGCPAVHISNREDGFSINLLQISMRVFLQNLEEIMFDPQPNKPFSASPLKLCARPRIGAEPN